MAITPTSEADLLDLAPGTVLEVQVKKPHQGSAQVVAVAPDGRYVVLKDLAYYLDEEIDRNRGAALPPPKGHPRN